MARFSRLEVWTAMEQVGLIPMFYHGDVTVAVQIVEALFAGGATVIEFTNRGDRAFEVFRELAMHCQESHPELILGAGSILDAVTAGLYINLGANFIVGSVLNAEVARLCNRRKVVYCPGCGSASEISEAEELGVEICKLFPAEQLGGPAFVQAIRAPCPWTKILVTGGVEASWENLRAWFAAGATCVGMGSNLVRKDLVAAQAWGDLTALTRQCLAWVRQARADVKALA
ncbi:MAG: bifunctional 4-hydroxy-2-oxoglutarate aldolase/2-dehydro-3-deoxy-phosphogluconate aldolase [Chloroflexi bacterium]|nr:bifunctional 4-hydroxy-2-oxoglutarate aldolase/2-dehydro-3-deoxy-phosphogluconate aldolase [Chloroflexota bacterium]